MVSVRGKLNMVCLPPWFWLPHVVWLVRQWCSTSSWLSWWIESVRSLIIGWLHCQLSFTLLRHVILCIGGSHCSSGQPVHDEMVLLLWLRESYSWISEWTLLCCFIVIFLILYAYVTLSHLRSKEFQRIHKPCQGYICIYTSVYPGKVVALQKEQATFIKARIALMWMIRLSSFYTSSDNNRLWE